MKLLEGEFYVVQNGQLQRVVRDNDTPKVPISASAKEALHTLRRGCRRVLGGFRPDIALVASALIEYAAALPQAQNIVKAYAQTVLNREREIPRLPLLKGNAKGPIASCFTDDHNTGQTAPYRE